MEGLLQRAMFELPSMSNVAGCLVDAAAVSGQGAIQWFYRELDSKIEAEAGG